MTRNVERRERYGEIPGPDDCMRGKATVGLDFQPMEELAQVPATVLELVPATVLELVPATVLELVPEQAQE